MRIFEATDFEERYTGRIPIHLLGDPWVVLAQGFDLIHDPFSLRMKRLTDLFTSGFLLFASLPIFVFTLIAVKFSSRGPILFRQTRVGLNGVLFSCYKFRSMVVGSERGDQYTQLGDLRITSVGNFLRKTRIHELPQLWNVLIGDMSLIGPRAEWDVLVRGYEENIPYYHMRHLVKPGLTGWAQINYSYGASVEDAIEKFQYDLWYIKHYGLLLDLRIFMKTGRVILFGMGR